MQVSHVLQTTALTVAYRYICNEHSMLATQQETA